MSVDWDQRFMELARYIGEWSKDHSRGVGCVIVGPNNEIRSSGFNGFPRGADDSREDRYVAPAKYKWTEHAERNAIYNAAHVGIPLAGCRVYVPWFPCMDCGRAIVQAGIAELICFEPDTADPIWGEDFRSAIELFREAGVKVRYLKDRPLTYPDWTIWYIEARSQCAEDPDRSGSAVAIRLRKQGETGRGRRYLLTCRHLVLGETKDGTPGFGPALEHLRVWAPGTDYCPDGGIAAKVSLITMQALSDVPRLERGSPGYDWALLEVPDKLQDTAESVHEIAEANAGQLLDLIGYPAGSSLIREGRAVEPTRSCDFRIDKASNGTLIIHGPKGARGMSGGGLFDATGRLCGIQCSLSDADKRYYAVAASDIAQQLKARGFEIVRSRFSRTIDDRATYLRRLPSKLWSFLAIIGHRLDRLLNLLFLLGVLLIGLAILQLLQNKH